MNTTRLTRWEWHGNMLILLILCLSGILIPVGIVYFVTNLLKVEEAGADSSRLLQYLTEKK